MTDIDMSPSPPGGRSDSVTQTAKEQARNVGQTAVQAGGGVVDTAKEQGRQVAVETSRQARDLYGQVRSQVSDQANAQQKRAVGGLHALSEEVSRMAEQGGQSGPATDLARQAATKIDEVARWLEDKEPGHVLDEVKSFARRNPGAFLAGAAVLGVLAGRLSKNLMPEPGAHTGDRGASRVTGTAAAPDFRDYPDLGAPTGVTTPTGYPGTGSTATGYSGVGSSGTGYPDGGTSGTAEIGYPGTTEPGYTATTAAGFVEPLPAETYDGEAGDERPTYGAGS